MSAASPSVDSSGRSLHGILLVDKPADITSAEVVRRAKRKTGGKVGHLGTLDPFATGLLPLCLGEGTKIAQFLNAADKQYEGTIALGRSTDTGDRTGSTAEEEPVPEIDSVDLQRAAAALTGELEQKPPMYSALKRQGVPLYKLARQGIEVEREARPIVIRELSLVATDGGRLAFHVHCTKGTYVRVLAEDIGRALGTVAHLETLRRTGFGRFRLDQGAVDIDLWEPQSGSGVLPIRQALADLPSVTLGEDGVVAVRRGQAWVLDELALSADSAEHALLVDDDGAVVAVIQSAGGRWRFARVLNS